MDKVYDHNKYESEIYKLWEKSGAFTPQATKHKSPFTIIMPPPNANDNLHIGHARFVTVEDVIIRYQRMLSKPTLWLPGADHAGIETQYVFEKNLAKQGKSRFDFSQSALFKMIWDYVLENKKNMEDQLRALGASCDWTRNKFTLDPEIQKIVYQTFKKLYDDGLIFRGERIVNYCPRCGTAFSQLEVDYLERDDPIYFLDYKTLTIATTRPETVFADCAVAVNPKDKRYKKLIGKSAFIPLIDKEIPIIEDILVDPEFGTGALKVTPGHDPTDFEIGQKHNLPTISVIDEEGNMINALKKYMGMKAILAREEIVKDLKEKGLLINTKVIHHTVGTCYRDKGLIEPMLSKQWFLKVEPLAKMALASIKNGDVRFTAKRFEKIAIHWLKNLKDWNLSRQIVWGMRIPAWQCQSCQKWVITDGSVPEKCLQCESAKLKQDPDTFDTWFSSGQWPFATLKTAKPGDFEYFYPTSVMETAYDILPFWVLRMIMLGLYETGRAPFKEVVIHGLVRDSEGQKISKSKGNVIDPLYMVEKYGADALRMGIVWGALVENDISLSEDNIRAQRNFANKVWNIARFVLSNKTGNKVIKRKDKNSSELKKEDKWILSELEKTIIKVNKAMDSYKLNIAAEEIYDFAWHKFADVYIEKSKSRKEDAQPTLEYILENILKLLHPFMPFVTEAIWKELRHYLKHAKGLIVTSLWPKI